MQSKSITIKIGKEYVEVELAFDDEEIEELDEEMMASYAMLAAYVAGDIEVTIKDIDPTEHAGDRSNLH